MVSVQLVDIWYTISVIVVVGETVWLSVLEALAKIIEPEQGGGNVELAVVELAVVAETDVAETIVVIWLKTPLKAWELIEFKELLEVFAGIEAGGTNNPFWLTGGVLVDLAP